MSRDRIPGSACDGHGEVEMSDDALHERPAGPAQLEVTHVR